MKKRLLNPAFTLLPAIALLVGTPTTVQADPRVRDVNVVGEPATPRDVNVLNTVNVSAGEPLPVTIENEVFQGEDFFSAAVSVPELNEPVIITTVPDNKLLLVTDLVASASQGSGFSFGCTTDPTTMTDVRLSANIQDDSTTMIHLQTPIAFTSGQQVAAVSFIGCGLSIVGKFVDVE